MTTTPTPMPPTPLTPRPNRARAGMRGRRGSAVILVIVSIVLMAILGATFVQVARFERVTPGGEHIDIAINSVLNEVSLVLAEDLYADDGSFFNPAGSAGLDGGGDEPYDYPWTNGTVSQRPVTFVNGNAGTAEGGVNDDPWLAQAFALPAGAGGSQWPHLSDLTGRILDVGHRDLTLVGMNNPGEVATTAAMVTNIRTEFANSPQLVDADGDGTGDSLWAYAPAAEIAGKRYVYAIRIVDLSSRININTSVGVTDATGNNNAGLPRGDTPMDIDSSGFAHLIGTNAGTTPATAVNEVFQTAARRFGGAATVPVAWGDTTNQRRHYWLNGASAVDDRLANLSTDAAYDPIDTYGEGDLFELLYKNGLNSTTVSQLEDDMPTLLRRDAVNEFAFTDTPNGIHSGGRVDFYTNRNPRNLYTTASGVVVFAPTDGTAGTLIGPDHDGDTVGERILQVDINHASATAIATAIAETIGANGTFDFTNFGNAPTASEVGSQLAANIIDCRDPDNRLTSFNGQFGMEALPFIAEVYSQREYAVPPAGVLNPDGVTYTITYTASGRHSDFAIEVRNPFNRPIELAGVHLVVNGADWGELSSLPTAPTELGVGEVMIIYRNNTAGENVVGGVAANHFVDLGATAHLFPIGMGTFSVGLHAEDQAAAGTALGWAYSRVDTDALPQTYVDSMAAGPTPIEPRPFLEVSEQGTGTGLNMLQVRPTDFVQTRTEPSEARGGASPALGNATKGFTVTNDWDTGDQQWLFLDKEMSATDNDGRIPYVADILTIPVVGPNDAGAGDNTLADAIAQSAATRLDGFMLDYRSSTAPVISNSFPSLNVPHAQLLLERLTTHSPAVDGVDLDGDGVDVAVGGLPDFDEAFLPGRINVNTASQNVLIGALPYPTGTQRAFASNRIAGFRQNPAGRPATSRSTTQPGIAYMGELYELLTADLAGQTPQPDWNNHQVGGATDDPYLGNPDLANADNITGDREEDLMLSKWLNEVCSTRSDVYAVYMVVQGFPEGNFGAGPVESARVIAVFSRANVRQVGDKAQLIAVRRVE